MFACIFAPDLNAEMSLADFAYRFSPLVEETQPNIVVIDVDGCEVLFGSAYQLATEIVQQSKHQNETVAWTRKLMSLWLQIQTRHFTPPFVCRALRLLPPMKS